MKPTENIEIHLTPEMKEDILNNEIEKLKQSYESKHKDLEDQEKDEIEKIKISVDKLQTISIPNPLSNISHTTTPKKKERKGWTPEELSELKKLHESGMKTQPISKKLVKSYQSVYLKIKELKEPK